MITGNVCQATVEAMLFFHPAVWWVSRRIRVERENCCDELGRGPLRWRPGCSSPARCSRWRSNGVRRPLRVAAAGGSLKERVRRLVSPASIAPCPAEAGWAGGGLIAGVFGLIAAGWLAGPTQARDEVAPKRRNRPSVGGVLDDAGRPVAGAPGAALPPGRPFGSPQAVVEEATAGRTVGSN
jgi:hypothetical protein